MIANILALSSLVLQAPGAPTTVEMSRLPRLPGKADVAVWRTVAPDRLVYGRALYPVFVRVSEPGVAGVLETAGFKTKLGRWIPVDLRAGQLLWALSADGVELRSAPAHWPQLEVSSVEIGADQVHDGVGLESARRGKGVLVGIIDTGVDLTHPAFIDASGNSRVVAVWDQDAAVGPGPKEFGYGHECKESDIVAGDCQVSDPVGHGTHVAGIAAGAGLVPGIAPEASIAVVRSDRFTRLADAVLYLCELADHLDMPLVVNMSVGGQYGPHDGKTPLEGYLRELVGPGRILVAAAGNDGGDRIHLGVELQAALVRVGLDDVPTAAPVETTLDFWSDPAASVSLALELWTDAGIVASVPLAASDTDLLDGTLEVGRARLFGVTFGADLDPDHGLVHRSLVLDATGGAALPARAWLAVAVSGQGRLDGWIAASDYSHGSPRFAKSRGTGSVSGDGDSSIVVPATAPDVITVGAYTVRTEWQSEDDGRQCLEGAVVGTLAPFSSRGPTTAPEYTGVKPDLVAPGSIIASARATSVGSGPMSVDAHRVVMQGTSMSAPHVTGVIALMLEANPELDPAQARDELTRTARTDAGMGSLPNVTWGAGKIDAVAAVHTAEAEAPTGCAAARADLASFGVVLLILAGRGLWGRGRRC